MAPSLASEMSSPFNSDDSHVGGHEAQRLRALEVRVSSSELGFAETSAAAIAVSESEPELTPGMTQHDPKPAWHSAQLVKAQVGLSPTKSGLASPNQKLQI